MFFNKKKTFNHHLFYILLLGIILRVLFIQYISHYYFARTNIFVDGDTFAWATCFENLYLYGTYTFDFTHEYGYFARTPGYSFFMGFFYLLSGKNWETAYQLIGWTQSLMDIFTIYIIYKIGQLLFVNKHTSLILAFIYATYPFIIVWNPVVYSEYTSIFFMLLGIYFFLKNSKLDFLFSSISLSLSALIRPQLVLLLFIICLYLLIQHIHQKKYNLVKLTLFLIPILLIYGSWPLRNYINYKKIIITQDIKGLPLSGEDWIAFTQYTYSVKAEWEPQFTDLISNKRVLFPKEAYISNQDSLKLEQAIYLAQHCSSSFSKWKGFWGKRISHSDPNCNKKIKQLFDELRINQIKHNPFNYYIILPLKNLKKAIFKSELNTPKNKLVAIIGKFLFSYRTLLLFLGMIGALMILKSKTNARYFSSIILSYFITCYLALCFGTGPQFRNIEIRYFLPADVLLLIPASYLIHIVLLKTKLIKN